MKPLCVPELDATTIIEGEIYDDQEAVPVGNTPFSHLADLSCFHPFPLTAMHFPLMVLLPCQNVGLGGQGQ